MNSLSPEFHGQGFLVVGGTHGIGRAVVLHAAEQGAQVVYSGCSEDEAIQVLAEANSKEIGKQVFFARANVTIEAEVEGLFDITLERLPRFNVLIVNNVPDKSIVSKPLAETLLPEWNAAVSNLLRPAFLIARRAVEEFLVSGEGGRIVYINAAVSDDIGRAVDHVTQTAMQAFIRSVVKEYGSRGISCNAIAVQNSQDENAVGTALFLASQEASFVNGEIIQLDDDRSPEE